MKTMYVGMLSFCLYSSDFSQEMQSRAGWTNEKVRFLYRPRFTADNTLDRQNPVNRKSSIPAAEKAICFE
ncbi:hypothetical protein SLU01_24650 [Sporosarcina luteola]|uniref:Uncharacterized protein n=1 Tax=Sporosarcina luteola TaxID=582850 RepID=A0A511Z9S8_9BACL|nr:hypothetical protein SLU01_24650 [Sporosarcina luteola]